MIKKGLHIKILFYLISAFFLFTITPIAHSGIIPGKYIIVLRDSAVSPKSLANEFLSRHGLELGYIFQNAIRGFAAAIPEDIMQKLRRDPRIKYIEPDRWVYAFEQTIPTGITRIRADINATANINGLDEEIDVDIAILDSGIDVEHPDLNIVQDITFVPFSLSGKDYFGHGTHVAGIIAARDNDIGVVGVAPGARLHAVKVLNRLGVGGVSSIIAGIDWVTKHADLIEVVNMSIGTTGYSRAMHDAIAKSVSKGIVYVVAAGNESTDVYGKDGVFGTGDDILPASLPEVAAVSALTDLDGKPGGLGKSTVRFVDDTFANFSNYSRSVVPYNPVISSGAAIDFAAPGVNILSTYKNGQYYVASGTSMAAPYAAGCVALFIAQYGRAHDAEGVAPIRQALIDSAEPQSAWGPVNTEEKT